MPLFSLPKLGISFNVALRQHKANKVENFFSRRTIRLSIRSSSDCAVNNLFQVSAHFFCRRCGVHVVHAPDFPHADVADVNVHCIRPETIKSLAVGFLRGGGVEVPGMGDPVEGMYEV